MRLVLEIPDDTPSVLVDEIRRVAETGYPDFICIRRPSHMSGEEVGAFAAACVDTLLERYGDTRAARN